MDKPYNNPINLTNLANPINLAGRLVRLIGLVRLNGLARLAPLLVHWIGLPPVRRTAARTLCKISLRTASGPEGSSAK
jgi:hypothetical protein